MVELRASRWAAQEQVSNYYQSKLNELVGFLKTADVLLSTLFFVGYYLFIPQLLAGCRRYRYTVDDRTVYGTERIVASG